MLRTIDNKEYDEYMKSASDNGISIEEHKIKYTDSFFQGETVHESALKMDIDGRECYVVYNSKTDIRILDAQDCESLEFKGNKNPELSKYLNERIKKANEQLNQKQNLQFYDSVIKSKKSKRKLN